MFTTTLGDACSAQPPGNASAARSRGEGQATASEEQTAAWAGAVDSLPALPGVGPSIASSMRALVLAVRRQLRRGAWDEQAAWALAGAWPGRAPWAQGSRLEPLARVVEARKGRLVSAGEREPRVGEDRVQALVLALEPAAKLAAQRRRHIREMDLCFGAPHKHRISGLHRLQRRPLPSQRGGPPVITLSLYGFSLATGSLSKGKAALGGRPRKRWMLCAVRQTLAATTLPAALLQAASCESAGPGWCTGVECRMC